MDINQIIAVLAVIETRSFTEASYNTFISQSTISKYVSSLEAELGVKLFTRGARTPVMPTEECLALLPLMNDLIHKSDEIKETAKTLQQRQKHILTIGYKDMIGSFNEEDIVFAFMNAYPKIDVQIISEKSFSDLIKQIKNSTLDAVFGLMHDRSSEYINASSLNDIELDKVTLKICLNSNHPAIHNQHVDLRKLKNETFFFLGDESLMTTDPKYKYFYDACKQEGFEPKVKCIKTKSSFVYKEIAENKGVSTLLTVPAECYPGTCILPTTKEYYSFKRILIYNKQKQTDELKTFIRFLKNNHL